MVPCEYYSTCMPHIFHLLALISYHNTKQWDVFPAQRASISNSLSHTPQAGSPVHQKYQNSLRLSIYLSFQGHWVTFHSGHTCDSQEKRCPCFWVELHSDSREGSKCTWRQRSCIVSSLHLSTGTPIAAVTCVLEDPADCSRNFH